MPTIITDEEPPLFKTADQDFVSRIIEEQEEGKLKDQDKTNLPQTLHRYLIKTKLDKVLEITNAIFSLTFMVLFATETYSNSNQIPSGINITLILISCYFILDFLLFFFMSENRLYYLFRMQSLITYITVTPTLLVALNIINDPVIIDTYSLRFWKVFRVFSIARVDKLFVGKNSGLARIYFKLSFSFFTTIIITASAILVIENKMFVVPTIAEIEAKIAEDPFYELNDEEALVPTEPYVFHDMIYYLTVTLTTAGYGDIYPRTIAGQYLIIIFFISLLSILTRQLNELSRVSALTSTYSRVIYKGKKDQKHILLLGDCMPDAILTFLTECYHSDHGKTETEVVIMRNQDPSQEIINILKMPQFESKVIYMKGSPLSKSDLKRSLTEKVSCCVILSNQFSMTPQQDDYKNILSAFSVKKYARLNQKEDDDEEVRVCLQISKPEHKDLFYSGLNNSKRIDQVLCVEELKLQLLAKSSICPGIITIIWSLITSNTTGSNEEEDPDDDLIVYINKPKAYRLNALQQNASIPMDPMSLGSGAQSKTSIEQKIRNSKHLHSLKKWQLNYQTGTKYELYSVPLKKSKFEGLKFKDICMILYIKKNIVLIALEIKVGNQIKVFVNPSDYVFGDYDHWGYVIHHCAPDYIDINKRDLQRSSVENFFIMEHISKREVTTNKKELLKIHMNLARLFEEQQKNQQRINFENFHTTKKPVPLIEARVKTSLDKSIEGHIIVCGIVKGIQNLILPLRSKTLRSQKRPIVILSNDNMGDENLNGDTFIWGEINRFEDIYLIRGSALNPADLEKARVQKAKAIIILAKSLESTTGFAGQQILDADAIFMYKTIEANYKNVSIVTELASMSAVAFLVQGCEEQQKNEYYMSKPFAGGEIYVGSLLNSLMCQAYYNPKIMDILDQMILGSANTPQEIMKVYQQLNLSQSSLNLVDIPKQCNSPIFGNIFEYCVKNHNMIPLGVYKRNVDESTVGSDIQGIGRPEGNARNSAESGSRKPYVWLHPPRNIELSPHDELYVLSDKNLKEVSSGGAQAANNDVGQAVSGKILKNEEKKAQKDNITKLISLHSGLEDLLFSTKELETNVEQSSNYINKNLSLKLRSDLDYFT